MEAIDSCGCSCGCGCDHTPNEDHREGVLLAVGGGLFAAGVLLSRFATVSLLCFLIAYGLLGWEVLKAAGKNLIRGHVFDENFLMSLATIGAFAIGEYPEAVGIMLFYRVGEFFEHRAVSRSRKQIMDAVDLRPETVDLLDEGEIYTVPAEAVAPGAHLRIRPGDRIPLDGIIVSGSSQIDTAPITGEPVPVRVGPGDRVLSGCINTSGQLTMAVEKPLSESLVTRILRSVENAAASKPKIDRFLTRFSRIYTPAVVLTATAVALIPSFITGNWGYWIYTALSFLVMSCPCALVLSVPLAFFSGIGAGSKQGILFKGGLVLEALAQVKGVIFDKTGTLTQGDFQVQTTHCTGEMFRLCASCEQASTHPIAASIVAAAKERGLILDAPEAVEEIPGHGILATVAGRKIACGNQKLMARLGLSPDGPAEAWGTWIWIAREESGRMVLAGSIQIADTLKADAVQSLERLHRRGYATAMLTGDEEQSAQAIAQKVGIRKVFSRLLPDEKLSALQTLRREWGAVLFVGDGINDAPVLSGADVGAAMGSGADAAIEAADLVFLTTQTEAIPQALDIARRTRAVALQNIIFALAVKLAVMVLGLLGFASMWAAVFADSGVAMLCVLNSVRLLWRKY